MTQQYWKVLLFTFIGIVLLVNSWCTSPAPYQETYSPSNTIETTDSTQEDKTDDRSINTPTQEVKKTDNKSTTTQAKEQNTGSYDFPIPELWITLELPSVLQPYLQYKKNTYWAVELFLTNYRDTIPSSEIPSHEDAKRYIKAQGWTYTYSVADHETWKKGAEKCFILFIWTQSKKAEGYNKEGYIWSLVLAENNEKQVIVTYPHEPCDAFHFFSLGKTSPDSTEITAYDKYVDPFRNILYDYIKKATIKIE